MYKYVKKKIVVIILHTSRKWHFLIKKYTMNLLLPFEYQKYFKMEDDYVVSKYQMPQKKIRLSIKTLRVAKGDMQKQIKLLFPASKICHFLTDNFLLAPNTANNGPLSTPKMANILHIYSNP